MKFPWVWLPQHSGMGCHGEMKVVASVPGDTDPIPTALQPLLQPPTSQLDLQGSSPRRSDPYLPTVGRRGAAGNTHLAQAERGEALKSGDSSSPASPPSLLSQQQPKGWEI